MSCTLLFSCSIQSPVKGHIICIQLKISLQVSNGISPPEILAWAWGYLTWLWVIKGNMRNLVLKYIGEAHTWPIWSSRKLLPNSCCLSFITVTFTKLVQWTCWYDKHSRVGKQRAKVPSVTCCTWRLDYAIRQETQCARQNTGYIMSWFTCTCTRKNPGISRDIPV